MPCSCAPSRVRVLLVCVALLGVAASSALAVYREYSPLTGAELSKRFPLVQRAVLDGDFAGCGSAAGPHGSRFELVRSQDDSAPDLLVLTGTDTQAKPWRVEVAAAFGCAYGETRLFDADVDADGVRDAIVYVPTCGNGLAPPVHIVIVTFDADGRPLPFEAEAYSDASDSSVEDLVDLDGDGRAELVFMNFSDHYWVTNVYRVAKGRWTLERGTFAQRSFPIFTRFTIRPNRVPTRPRAQWHPEWPDLSTREPLLSGRLMSWRPEGTDGDRPARNMQLEIQARAGQIVKCAPDYWYGSARVIYDKPQGRWISLVSAAPAGPLREAIERRYPVRLYGHRPPEECSPEIIWVDGAESSAAR